MSTKETLGQRIAKVREARGWTQETVAQLLKISPTAYAKIERNETDVQISCLEAIAQVLEVELWTFFSSQNPIMIMGDVKEKSQVNGYNNTQNNYTIDKEVGAYIARLEKELDNKQATIEVLHKTIAFISAK